MPTTANASSVTPDQTDPIWTIEHIARCFHLSVDRAREYTGRDDFPAARRLGDAGGRLLWTREDVLAWFLTLPPVPAAARRRRRVDSPAPAVPAPAKPGAYRPSYKPRARRAASKGRAA